MANTTSFLDTASSLQLRELANVNENKENAGAVKTILENYISNKSFDKGSALSLKFENRLNIISMFKNKMSVGNSIVSNICCDMCGKHFQSICYLRDHHFICMKDKKIEYTGCDESFSKNDVHKIHMCKHLCLNGNLHELEDPNLISESDSHCNEEFVSENPDEVIRNVQCGNAMADDNAKLSNNSNVSDSQNCTNELPVSELVSNFKSPLNLHAHINDESSSFSENDSQCIKILDGSLKLHEEKHIQMEESSKVLLKNVNETSMRKYDAENTDIINMCYSNDKKSVGPNIFISKSSPSNFICAVCDQKFISQYTLNNHYDVHKNHEIYSCTECSKQFSHIDNFLRHVKFHRKQKLENHQLFTCKVCLKSFKWESRLNKHFRIHSNKREFRCTICGKGFNQKCTLTSHMLTHTGEKPHKCTLCTKRFTTSSALSRHLKRHSGDKPHQCDVCFYRFALLVDLKKHYKKHTGEKPFECNICPKRLRSRASLNAHIASHTGNQPHECDICHKKFFHKYSLTSHKQLHTKDKKFSCDICDKSYKTKSRLQRHCQFHTGEKPFVCSDCNKAFTNRGALDRHILIHTGMKPYECEICQRLFNQKTSLQRHQVVHTKEKPYSCDICKKCYTQKSYLSIHKLSHSRIRKSSKKC